MSSDYFPLEQPASEADAFDDVFERLWEQKPIVPAADPLAFAIAPLTAAGLEDGSAFFSPSLGSASTALAPHNTPAVSDADLPSLFASPNAFVHPGVFLQQPLSPPFDLHEGEPSLFSPAPLPPAFLPALNLPAVQLKAAAKPKQAVKAKPAPKAKAAAKRRREEAEYEPDAGAQDDAAPFVASTSSARPSKKAKQESSGFRFDPHEEDCKSEELQQWLRDNPMPLRSADIKVYNRWSQRYSRMRKAASFQSAVGESDALRQDRDDAIARAAALELENAKQKQQIAELQVQLRALRSAVQATASL